MYNTNTCVILGYVYALLRLYINWSIVGLIYIYALLCYFSHSLEDHLPIFSPIYAYRLYNRHFLLKVNSLIIQRMYGNHTNSKGIIYIRQQDHP